MNGAAQARDFSDVGQGLGDNVIRAAIAGAEKPALVGATAYRCRDPHSMPLRPWVYGRQLLRGSLSLIVAPGAVGKTSLLVGTALALATGRDLLGKQVWEGPKRVWLWNLEDSGEEMARLIEAARLHWRLGQGDLDGRLFVDSALDGAELKLAVEDRDGFRIMRPLVDALVAELLERKIDVLIVDPFVSSHSASENDNGAIDAIAKEWARVGVRANCSIVLAHHTRKLGGGEANAEGARGAIALVGAARSVIALNKMSEEEANGYGIEGEERRRYFRAYDDKNNRTPPADQSDWYQLASVHLGNGPMGASGDSIQVVLPWSPPDVFAGVTVGHLQQVQEAVRGGSWKFDVQAEEWVGLAVAPILKLNVDERKGRDAKRVKKLVDVWIANGALKKVTQKCEKSRRDKPFVLVGQPVVGDCVTPYRGGDAG
jgi:hypothetical protein